MALKDIFSKKPKAPGGRATPISSSTYAEVVEQSGNAIAIVLCERYSEHESKPLENDLLTAASGCANRLIIDMSRVTMLASAGIGSLISIHQACTKEGGKLVICALDENIGKLMSMTRMDKMLNIVATREEATEAMG